MINSDSYQSELLSHAECHDSSECAIRTHHNSAVMLPHSGLERALVSMVAGWREFEDYYKQSKPMGVEAMSDDPFLADDWNQIGIILRRMLAATNSRLHYETLDDFIKERLKVNGFKGE